MLVLQTLMSDYCLEYDVSRWECIDPPVFKPVQSNLYDCGMFIILYAKLIEENFKISWSFKQQYVCAQRQQLKSILIACWPSAASSSSHPPHPSHHPHHPHPHHPHHHHQSPPPPPLHHLLLHYAMILLLSNLLKQHLLLLSAPRPLLLLQQLLLHLHLYLCACLLIPLRMIQIK